MRRSLSVALLETTSASAPSDGPLLGLRNRFANASCREEVEIDFLEDDLEQANRALGTVTAYLGRLERSLGQGWTSRQALASLAFAVDPHEGVAELADLLADVRRRLLRLADQA